MAQRAADVTTSEHISRIAADGYTIVESVLGEDACAGLLDELDRLEAELGTVPAGNSFEGAATTRVYNLLAHGPSWQAIAEDARILSVVEGVLDPGCLVSSLSSVAIRPGEIAQPIHADDQMIPLPKPHPPTVCNSMWALTPFTEENGATRIIPGTHLADRSPDYGTHYDSIAAEMPAGSVLVWHGSLWHGGGANRSDRRRVGIAMNYCAGWIRQQENQQLGLSPDLVESFSPRLRDLVGYGTYQGLIGHIDRRTPAKRFFGSPTERNLWESTDRSARPT